MVQIEIKNHYLWFPVQPDGDKQNIQVKHDSRIITEFDIEQDGDKFTYYAWLDVSGHIGNTLALSGDFSAAWAANIRNEPDIPDNQEAYPRPKLHYTARFGWINDPNGMIYHNGVYHMYYQHNPYGVIWDNMHWGHAVSTDLVHWSEQDEALYPDENGTMFSGCAVQDRENLLGYGADAILFYYTAAGGTNRWSEQQGKKFTQRLAVSTDGGNTLVKSDAFCLPHMAGSNRDPKVFWHESTKAYVMVLFLDVYDFAVFCSTDLLHWEQTQTITVEGMWECPDLFALPVDGNSEMVKWIFWSADGYYLLGEFDGYTFTAETDRLCAYGAKIPYAAQTYSGISDRVISQSFLKIPNRGTPYTTLMGIPVEYTLKTTAAGLRLAASPVRELERVKHTVSDLQAATETQLPMNGQAAELSLNWQEVPTGITSVVFGATTVEINFDARTIRQGEWETPFPADGIKDLQIIVDIDVTELFGAGGTLHLVCPNTAQSLETPVSFSSDTPAGLGWSYFEL